MVGGQWSVVSGPVISYQGGLGNVLINDSVPEGDKFNSRGQRPRWLEGFSRP